MNKIEFEIEVKKIFTNISDNFFSLVEIYKEFLRKENQKYNLTRLDEDDKIYSQYFYESIVPYKTINFLEIKTVLDIGSGSGIPGIVLKMLYPHLELSIIESNNKKIEFMKQLTKLLKLENIEFLYMRAEEIKPNQRETFDLVTSRAVAKLKAIVEVSAPYCKVGGYIVEPKSISLQQESVGLDQLLLQLHAQLERTETFTSINDVTHNVVFIKKIKETDASFPRA
jgi:16S rRNA (guanine527-N7)-methyltransferase